VSERVSEAEELKEVLSSITAFLKDLTGPLKELLDTLLTTVSGESVGKDVATFYRKLKEEGLPDDLVSELTKKYYEQRMAAGSVIQQLIGKIVERKPR